MWDEDTQLRGRSGPRVPGLWPWFCDTVFSAGLADFRWPLAATRSQANYPLFKFGSTKSGLTGNLGTHNVMITAGVYEPLPSAAQIHGDKACKVGTLSMSILQVRKLRNWAGAYSACGHTAIKWQSWVPIQIFRLEINMQKYHYEDQNTWTLI